MHTNIFATRVFFFNYSLVISITNEPNLHRFNIIIMHVWMYTNMRYTGL